MKAIESRPAALKFAAENFKNDREIVLKAVESDGAALEFAAENFKNDREIVLKAIESKRAALKFAAENIKADQEFIFEIIENIGGWMLMHASEKLKTNRQFVIKAVELNGAALEFAAENLKNDREVVLSAARSETMCSCALMFASESLKSNSEFVIEVMKSNKYGVKFALEYSSENIKADRKVVLEAVKLDPYAEVLEFAAESLKADREVVLTAVKLDGRALRFADKSLKNDREVVLTAIKSEASAIEYASESLKADREVVLTAIKGNSWSLSIAAESLKSDREFVLDAVKLAGSALEHVDKSLQDDREVVLTAIKSEAWAIEYASESLKAELGSNELDQDRNDDYEEGEEKDESISNLEDPDEQRLFSIDDDYFPLKDFQSKSSKRIDIGKWSFIRFGFVSETAEDNEDNDFIENQVGISITIGEAKVDGQEFILIDLGSGRSALCKNLLGVRDDYGDDLIAFTETLFKLDNNLFNNLNSQEKEEIFSAINKLNTRDQDFWNKFNSASATNKEIPFTFWLLSALTLAAKDQDENWIKTLTWNQGDLDECFFEENDNSPVANYAPAVFMICSEIEDQGEFSFNGSFCLDDCEDEFEDLSEFYGYVSDYSWVKGLQSSKAKKANVKSNDQSEKINISHSDPKSKEELSIHLNNIIEGEIYPKIEKRLSELIDLTIDKRYFEDLKFIDDPELIFNDPTSFDFSKHDSPSSDSLYVWIHEYLKQNNLYIKFLTRDQLKIAENVPFGEIYLPSKEESYGLLNMHISNLHLHCLVVVVKEGLKCGANVDESRKYLEDLGIKELLVDIKKLEEEQNPSNEYTDPFEGINNAWEQRDVSENPVGFVRLPVIDLLEFFPIQVDSEYLCSDNRKRQLSDLDRAIFGKVKNQIDDKGLNSFPTFIENPDEGCFQNELLFWIKNDDSIKDILLRKCNDEEIEKIEEWMEQSEGGFRPTLYVDSDDEDYSFAEEAEGLFNLLEGNAIFFAASEAAKRGDDLSLIYEYFEECGWDEEIEALKKFASLMSKK